MRLPITPANTLWRALRDEIRDRLPGGRVIVAVDGPGAAMAADGVAAAFGELDVAAFRAHADDFQLPRARRRPDARYDWSLLRRVLLDPFRDAAHTSASTGFQLAAFDALRDRPVLSRWVTAPADAVLLVDGADLDAAPVREVWDWRARSGAGPADAVLDLADPEHPARDGIAS